MRFTRKIKLISLFTALLPLIMATLSVTLIVKAELFREAESKLTAVREIKQRLTQLKALMAQNAAAAEQQTSVSATLAHSISNLSVAAEQNRTAISEGATNTQYLLGLATELGCRVGQFKV